MSTPYMNLNLPTPTVTLGPAYASQNNTAFTTIDGHNHTAGSGVAIPSNAIQINGDLTFNDFNLTNIRSSRYVNQSGNLNLGTDLNITYVQFGDLYYVDGAGNQIQLTAGGAINTSSAGQITGMGGTAATASYSALSSAFNFSSGVNTPANFQVGPISIGNNSLNSNAVTIKPPTALGTSYTLTLPTGLPISTKILTVSNTGSIGAAYDVDNSTIVVSSNIIQVPAGGIAQANLAFRPTGTPAPAGGVAISGSSGNYVLTSAGLTNVPNLSVIITTTGRPVMLSLQAAASSTSPGFSPPFQSCIGSSGGPNCYIGFALNGFNFVTMEFIINNGGVIPPSAVSYLFPVAAGSHAFTAQVLPGSGSISILNCVLVAYEI